MKRIILSLLTLCLAIAIGSCNAEAELPELPEGTLFMQDISLEKWNSYEVYNVFISNQDGSILFVGGTDDAVG